MPSAARFLFFCLTTTSGPQCPCLSWAFFMPVRPHCTLEINSLGHYLVGGDNRCFHPHRIRFCVGALASVSELALNWQPNPATPSCSRSEVSESAGISVSFSGAVFCFSRAVFDRAPPLPTAAQTMAHSDSLHRNAELNSAPAQVGFLRLTHSR